MKTLIKGGHIITAENEFIADILIDGEAIAAIGAVVEGYYAVASAQELSQRLGVEMPITQAAYEVLYHGKAPETVLQELMGRAKRHESEESWR